MTNWQYYPKSDEIPAHLMRVVRDVFDSNETNITSSRHKHNSNKVLEIARKNLENLGYFVESGKGQDEKVKIPVLFGRNGKLEKSFDADGWNKETKTVIEIEAGRGVTNYQFLKDLFQACVMHDIDYHVICVRNDYRGKDDFGIVINFFNTMYSSNRIKLPLKGILVIGY